MASCTDVKLPRKIFSWFNLFAVSGILFVHFYPSHPDRFRDQAYLIFMGLWTSWALLVMNQIRSKAVLPILVWLGYSAARVFAVKFSPYGKLANWFDGPASITLLWITLSITLLSIGIVRGILFEVFKITSLINSVLLIFAAPGVGGILNNPSLDATLIACVSPLILFSGKDYHWSLKLLLIAGVIASKSATGLFALIAVFLSYAILTQRTKTALVSIPILGLGVMLQGDQILASNGRLFIWEMIWNWFSENGNWFRGMGLGTFEILGPGIQRDHGMTQGFFVYLHNEWFQVLFELGLIGLTLTLLFYGWVLIKNKDTQLRVCWLTLGLIAMTQNPLRIPILGIWSAMLCLELIDWGERGS